LPNALILIALFRIAAVIVAGTFDASVSVGGAERLHVGTITRAADARASSSHFDAEALSTCDRRAIATDRSSTLATSKAL
jgi:hypothetical protein